MSDQPEIHPTHDPEPDREKRVYAKGTACRRCCWFVAFDEDSAFPPRVTQRGAEPCTGPMRISLRHTEKGAA